MSEFGTTEKSSLNSGNEDMPSRRPIPWWKKVIFFIVYSLLILVFFIVAAELVFRVFKIAPVVPPESMDMVADPFINHKPRPDSVLKGRHEGDGYEYEYRHNSLGFREREIPEAKPEGEFRILGIGDSFMYGVAADAEFTILNQLKARLNTRPGDHPPVEVINMGISGFYPEASGHVLQHYGLRFQPDLVIMNFYPNDVHETYVSKNESMTSEHGWLMTRHARRIGKVGAWAYVHFHIARPVIRAYLAHWDETYLARLDADEILKDDGRYEGSWRRMLDDILAINAMAEGAGARFVLVNMPTIEFEDNKMDYPARRLEAWCREHGILFIDTLPALREAARQSREPLYWKHDIHPTPRGYEIMTGVIFEQLTSMEAVP